MENKFSKDLITVLFSNIVVLVSSVVTGFLIPDVLGVYEYGIYKIFTLYLSYSALMHLGFVDGILLKFADKYYNELPKEKVRTFTKFFFIFQCIVTILIIFIANFFLSEEYKMIISLLGVDILAVNMTAYYQYISQATMRFTELSIRKILLAGLKIILVCSIALFEKFGFTQFVNAEIYVAGLVLIDIGIAIWYFKSYEDISVGKHFSVKQCDKEILGIFREGIILTVAFQTASVIFSLDRQFVSIFFDTETYGVYSFAYSIISMVTTVIGAISFVLFPRLKRLSKETIIETFSGSMDAITMVSVAAMLGYQPLCVIISGVLPEYAESITYLKIIIPGLALSCCINIIMFTYYKALNKQAFYFKVCCIVLIIATILNYLVYRIFESPIYISMASIASLLIWYLLCEYFFIKNYHIRWKKSFFYILISMFLFYFETSVIQNQLFSWGAFICSYLLITFLFYKDFIISIFSVIIRHAVIS